MYLQHLLLLGRATKDPETLTSKNGKIFAKFSIAVNEYMGPKVDEKTYYYNIVVFDTTAPKVIERVKKGDIVFIQGRPEVEAYISKKDDSPKGSISVVAKSWQVIK